MPQSDPILDAMRGGSGAGIATLPQSDDIDDSAEVRADNLARNKGYSKRGPYGTPLSGEQESQFQQWVKANKIPWSDTPDADYDMRGYWLAQQNGDPLAQRGSNLHFPDKWKTPYSATFSNESKYATPGAPHWEGDTLTPTDPILAAMQAGAGAQPTTPPVKPFSTVPSPSGSLTQQADKLGAPPPFAPPTNGPRMVPGMFGQPILPAPIQEEVNNQESAQRMNQEAAQQDQNAAEQVDPVTRFINSTVGNVGKSIMGKVARVPGQAPMPEGMISPVDAVVNAWEGPGKMRPALEEFGENKVTKAALESASDLLTPDNLALAVGMEGLPPGLKLSAAGKVIMGAGFTIPQAVGLVKQYPEMAKAIRDKDWDSASKIAAGAIPTIGFTALGIKDIYEGIAQGVGITRNWLDARAFARDQQAEFARRQAEARPKLTTGEQPTAAEPPQPPPQPAPETQPPAPRTAASEPIQGEVVEEPPAKPAPKPTKENLVPETEQTLAAQTEALKNGTNKVVYFPRGTKSLPEPPDGSEVTTVGGNNAGAGTYYHDPSVTSTQIREAVKDGTYGELLGHVQTKEEATVPGTTPATIVARDATSGVEQKASVVDTSEPEKVAAQSAALQAQFPESKISIETPQQTIAARQATPTPKETAKPQEAVSRETPLDLSAIAKDADVDYRGEVVPGSGVHMFDAEPNKTFTVKDAALRASEDPAELVREAAERKLAEKPIVPQVETRKALTDQLAQRVSAMEAKVASKGEITKEEVNALHELSYKIESLPAEAEAGEQPGSAKGAIEGKEPAAEHAESPSRTEGAASPKRAESEAPAKRTEGAERPESVEPQFAYRVRTEGEEGIPSTSHSQATVSEEEARGYMESRGNLEENEGKNQELVRVDLNKLPEDSYSLKKGPNGNDWVKFNEPVPESSVEKVEEPKDHILEAMRAGEEKPEPKTENGRTLEAEEQSNGSEREPESRAVGEGSAVPLAEVPPENVQANAGRREPGRPLEERGGEGEGSNRGELAERNAPARGAERGEEATPVSADRGGSVEAGRELSNQSRPGKSGLDYRITEADHLGEGSVREKFAANAEAIRVLKGLEASGRPATAEEQAKLVKYTGWGWSGNRLNEYHDEWRNERKELQKLLTDEEYRAALASTKNAHYTSPEVIKAMWDGMRRLGFTGGRILEPSAGVGHFLGLMPNDLFVNSRATAIELDPISGRIAQQLYQNADVRIRGFEKLAGLNDFYDVAISNVPFGDYKVYDKPYEKYKQNIHNYFVTKMLDKVRPGGIVAAITTHHTMDAGNPRVRAPFAERGDLLAAIRLPGGAFEKNAGTDVTTDILIFRKRGPEEKPSGEPFANTQMVEGEGKYGGTEQIPVNEYFAKHPEMALGRHSMQGKMQMGETYKLLPGQEPLSKSLNAAIESLPEGAMKDAPVPHAATRAATVESVPKWGDTKPFGYDVKNGKVYRFLDGQMVHQADYPKTSIPVLKDALGIRDATRELFKAEGNGRPPAELSDARGRLNRLYNAFVKKHGFINATKNVRAMADDPDAPLLWALEKWDAKEKTAKKADVFFKQTVAPRKEVTSVERPEDALPAALAEKGRIDFDYMEKISGLTPEQMQSTLRESGLAFKTPSGHWESTDEYLSGNVRAKLLEAEEASKLEPEFKKNVEALKAVQPRDLEAGEIGVRLGTPWIPEEDIAKFIDEHILENQGGYRNRTRVSHVASEGIWKVDNGAARWNEAATTKWGTARVRPVDLIEGALNLRRPTVYDRTPDDKSIVNEKETLAAREKLEAIEEAFKNWIFKDPERAERLVKHYNENYNNLVDRDWDGSHLTFPGMSAGISLRPSQKNGAWRSIVGANTLLAHVVGAGKTFTIIGSAMEKKRLGLAKKPVIVVPNHLVEQWSSDFLKLYPQANVLAATRDRWEKDKRRELMSQIATGDWDAVIVPHSSFTKLPVGDEIYKKYAQRQLDMIEEHLQALRESEGKRGRTVKELEKAKARVEARLEKALNREAKDNTINFEDTGIDAMYVDEAHAYKNLFFSSKMGNINGIPKSDAQRAFDMYIKTKYITDLNNGSGVTFATGTPVSNTMAETYTMMRYMNEEALEQAGMAHFDSWAAAYGQTTQNMEVSPEDPTRFRVSTRFAKFVNVAELKRMFRQNADVILPEDLAGIVKTPDIQGGKPTVIEVPASQRQLDYIKQLGDRATKIRKKEVRPDEDNMLKITGEGRKVALDYRSIDPGAADDGQSKIAVAARKIADIYHDTRSTKRTQAVMLDLMTPTDAAKKRGQFNAYADLKNKLVGMGVPANEIAFIHDAKTDAAKQTLFDRVNSGDVAVVVGSSEKMGVGTNIQERLLALHHVDAPWRPADIEQREGRIVRQGNSNPVVQIYRYVTQGTFDAYMWSTISRKAQFIKEIMQHGYDVRELEDADGAALSYAEAAAIATGDKRVLEKVQTDADVDKLSKLKSIHEQQRTSNQVKLAALPQRIAGAEEMVKAVQGDKATRDKNAHKEFHIDVHGGTYTERKDAGAALNAAAERNRGLGAMKVGKFNGLDVVADGSGNLHLSGKASYYFSTNHENPLGTVQSMERTLAGLDTREAEQQEIVKQLKQSGEALRAEMDKPFPKQKELDRALAKQKELNEALAVNKEDKTMAGAGQNQEFNEDFKAVGPTKPQTEEEQEEGDVPRSIEPRNPEAGFLSTKVFRDLGNLVRRAFFAMTGRTQAGGAAPPQGPPRRPPTAVGPEPPERGPERAGNIRLDKLNAPEDVLNEIRRAAKENAEEFNEQRRGKIPFGATRSAAEKLVEEGMFTEKDLENMKKGTTLNAEELLAARGMLIASAKRVRELAVEVGTDPTPEKVLAFQQALIRHNGIQKAVTGAVAEAGRALSQQRMVANTLSGKDKSAHERVLEALGGQDLSEEAAWRLSQIPEDDYVALNNFLRSQKQWTTAQKIEAYWVANVLSSPRTPIKKVLGDLFLGTAEAGTRVVAGAIDPILAALQGRPREFFIKEGLVAPLAYMSAIPEATRKAAYIIAHGFDYDDLMKMEMPFKYEMPGGIANPLNFGGRALAAATKFFQVAAFQSEIHAQAVKQALKEGLRGKAASNRAAELVQHPTVPMVDAAEKQAQFQTYTEAPDTISRWFMQGRDRIKLPKGVPIIGGMRPLRFIIPFVQIPYNVAKDAFRYSPFGAARLNDWEKAKSPEASKILSRAMIGTAIMGFFAYLAGKELLTGAAPSQPAERDEFYRSGKQPYSVRIDNKWLSYTPWGPFALTAAAVAAYHDKFRKGMVADSDKAIAIGAAMGQALLDESFMRGLKNLVDALNEPDRFAGNLAASIAGGFVPMESALRTLNDSLDPTVRSPKNMFERIQAGLPVVSKGVQAKLDALGRPSEKEGSRGVGALVPGGLAPAEAKTDIDKELARLEPMGLKPIGFAAKYLTVDKYRLPLEDDERQDYQALRGKYLRAYLGNLFKSSEYKQMSDADKVDEAESAIRDAEHDAREQMIDAALDRRRQQFSAKAKIPRTAPGRQMSAVPAQ